MGVNNNEKSFHFNSARKCLEFMLEQKAASKQSYLQRRATLSTRNDSDWGSVPTCLAYRVTLSKKQKAGNTV